MMVHCNSCGITYDGNAQCCMDMNHTIMYEDDARSVDAIMSDAMSSNGEEEEVTSGGGGLIRQNAINPYMDKFSIGGLLFDILIEKYGNMKLKDFPYDHQDIEVNMQIGNVSGDMLVGEYIREYLYQSK